MAKDEYQDGGTLEIDSNAVVSISEDNGAYIQAWVWVSNPPCKDCGEDIEGEPAFFMGTSARCRKCHDRRMENEDYPED